MPDRVGVLKPYLDANLPPINKLTLPQWNAQFNSRAGSNQRTSRDTFALTGRYVDQDDGQEYRAKLDIENSKIRADMKIFQECDIDSVIGILPTCLPLLPTATFKYYMLPSDIHTLESNLHIPGIHIPTNEGESKIVPLHQIPNARFGEVDGALVRIFFPHLWDGLENQGGSSYVNATVLKPFYDKAVQPAAQEVLGGEVRTWPPNFRSETFRAESQGSGPPQQTGRGVHGGLVNRWIKEIRNNVAKVDCLRSTRDFFFAAEIRGIKASTKHPVPEERLANDEGDILDPNSRRMIELDKVLREWDVEQLDPDSWYFDIGTTINVTGPNGVPRCAFVRRDKHAELLKHLTGKDAELCRRWVTSSTGLRCYSVDEISHLGDIAGCRLDLNNSQPSEDGVYYIQVYSTEKSVTYRLQGQSNSKRTSPKRILEDWKRERDKHFIPLQTAYISASSPHDVAVRIESRVTMRGVALVHTQIPDRDLRNWLIQVENTAYWGFKANRLMAINSTLDRMMKPRSTIKLQQLVPAGSLLLSLSWMANALVNRPDCGGHWDEVHDAGCVHVQFEHDVVPCRPMGIYYLHSLEFVNSIPVLSSQRVVSKDTLLYLADPAKNPRLSEIELFRMMTGGLRSTGTEAGNALSWGADDEPPPLATASHTSNRQRHVRLRLEDQAPNVFSSVLAELEQPEARSEANDDPEEDEEMPSLSQQVSNIVFNYPVQVFAKVPNSRNLQASWCTIDHGDRTAISDDIFRDKERLRTAFVSYNCLGYDSGKWNATVAAWFPQQDELQTMRKAKTKIQGLVNLGVWSDWETVFAQHSRRENTKITNTVRAYVHQKWKWLPVMAKSHLWPTGTKNLPSSARQVGPVEGGPWIVLNPRLA